MVASSAARDASGRWHASSSTLADMTASGSVIAPASPGIGSHTTRRAKTRHSELKADPALDHPGPRDGLGRYELVRRGVRALDHIGQVLNIDSRRPGILRDAHRGVKLRN